MTREDRGLRRPGVASANEPPGTDEEPKIVMERRNGHARPIALVDVDGVIAPVGPSDGDRSTEGELRLPYGFHLRLVPDVRAKFADLEEAFECVWATAWEGSAPRLLAPLLGFGSDWPVIGFWASDGEGPTWKLPAVIAWCEEHAARRAVVWIDDDLQPDAEGWARARPRTLLVRTDPGIGITHEQVREAIGWAATTHGDEARGGD